MNKEIAGKILSDVSGSSDTKEATAKELKATMTKDYSVSVAGFRWNLKLRTRDAHPQCSIDRLQTTT